MDNLVEKILCVEVLEKISRMRRYLFFTNSSARSEGKEVINLFAKALDATQKNLENLIKYLKFSGSLNPYEKASVSRRISNVFFTIIKMHEQLQLIYGEWVRPETHTFIKEVNEFFPKNRRNNKINIVLTNDYMFFEGNLTWLFTDILSENHITPNLVKENPTVFLPKIDFDNPLNWTILVHECGHTDLKGIEKLLNNTDVIPENLPPKNKKILSNWVEEIYADLIATKILGPAYLASFSSFVLLLSGIEGNERYSSTHPSNVLRINLIYEYLDSRNIVLPINKSFLNSSDLGSYYYYMLENYNETSRKYLFPDISQEYPSLDTTALLDLISDEVDDLIDLSVSLSSEDFKRITSLKDRLSNGIPIASFHDIELITEVKENYAEGFDSDNELEHFNEVKQSLQETRTKLWEIINTGWINKVETILPEAIKLFFEDEDRDFNEKMQEFNNKLEKNDMLLLKSIESSEIFKIMEEQ